MFRGLHLVKGRAPGYTSYRLCGAGCEPCPTKARMGVNSGLLREGQLGSSAGEKQKEPAGPWHPGQSPKAGPFNHPPHPPGRPWVPVYSLGQGRVRTRRQQECGSRAPSPGQAAAGQGRPRGEGQPVGSPLPLAAPPPAVAPGLEPSGHGHWVCRLPPLPPRSPPCPHRPGHRSHHCEQKATVLGWGRGGWCMWPDLPGTSPGVSPAAPLGKGSYGWKEPQAGVNLRFGGGGVQSTPGTESTLS